MISKRLIALSLFTALALAPSGFVRAQWIATNSPAGGSVNSFAMLGSKMFAGTQEIGVLVSTDAGANWASASSDLAQSHITALAVSGSKLYAGTFYAQIYRSTDSGSSWTLLNTGAYDEIRAFEVTGESIFAATGLSGVLRSTDGGARWTKVSQGLSTNYINDFAVVGSNLYAAGAGVFRSTNNGTNWQPFSYGLTDSASSSLAVIDSTLFLATTSGIFTSRNGLSWRPTTDLLPPYTISVQTLLPIGDNLFAGTFYGLYQTSDYGSTWYRINTGLTDSTSICRLTTDGYDLFVGTFYGAKSGIWRRSLSEMIPQSAVSRSSVVAQAIRSYPNPFSQSTTISFTPKASGYAEVSIVNLLGVEVARIFSGELAAGEHAFVWNPANLPDGMYECLVRMNGRMEKVPIMLMR